MLKESFLEASVGLETEPRVLRDSFALVSCTSVHREVCQDSLPLHSVTTSKRFEGCSCVLTTIPFSRTFFQKSFTGKEASGIHDTSFHSIMKCTSTPARTTPDDRWDRAQSKGGSVDTRDTISFVIPADKRVDVIRS